MTFSLEWQSSTARVAVRCRSRRHRVHLVVPSGSAGLVLRVVVTAVNAGGPESAAGTATAAVAAPTSVDAVRPFDARSPWNSPIAIDQALDPKSSTYIHGIGDNNLPLTSDVDQYTIPVYLVTPSTPLRTVKFNGYYSTYEAGDNSRVGHGYAPTINDLPIPDNATGGVGTDGQLVLWDALDGVEYGYWQFSRDSSGAVTATNGYRYHTTAGYNGRFADGLAGRGAGMPYSGGLVRRWEIAQGHIDHALAFAYNFFERLCVSRLEIGRRQLRRRDRDRSSGRRSPPVQPAADGPRLRCLRPAEGTGHCPRRCKRTACSSSINSGSSEDLRGGPCDGRLGLDNRPGHLRTRSGGRHSAPGRRRPRRDSRPLPTSGGGSAPRALASIADVTPLASSWARVPSSIDTSPAPWRSAHVRCRRRCGVQRRQPQRRLSLRQPACRSRAKQRRTERSNTHKRRKRRKADSNQCGKGAVDTAKD